MELEKDDQEINKSNCGADYVLATLYQDLSMSELGRESRTYKEALIKHPELKEFQGPMAAWSDYEDNPNKEIEMLIKYKHIIRGD